MLGVLGERQVAANWCCCVGGICTLAPCGLLCTYQVPALHSSVGSSFRKLLGPHPWKLGRQNLNCSITYIHRADDPSDPTLLQRGRALGHLAWDALV